MNIVLADGFIATNIGNAFFNDGIFHMLKDITPEANIYRFGDVASQYWGARGRGPKNEYSLLHHIQPDYLIVSGPMLTTSIGDHYHELFETMNKIGTRIALISCGGYTYNTAEVDACKKFFEHHDIDFMSTRDSMAFHHYQHSVSQAYDGVCGAWSIPKYFKPIESTADKDYVAMCFDTSLEPTMPVFDDPADIELEINDTTEHRLSTLNPRLGQLFRRGRYAASALVASSGLTRHPDSIDNYDIIRLSHSPMSRPGWVNYAKPNTYASDVPEGYLNIYANATVTLTDRVHAAVASLAQGTPARLFTRSRRAHLFDRVGAGDVLDKVTTVNPAAIESHVDKMKAALKGYFHGSNTLNQDTAALTSHMNPASATEKNVTTNTQA